MYQVIFNSGFIGFLIWLLLFAVSTAVLAIAIRCAWSLRKSLFATTAFKENIKTKQSLTPLQNRKEHTAFDGIVTGRLKWPENMRVFGPRENA